MTVSSQMVVGFLLALLFSKQFPLRGDLLILVLTPMMLSFVAVGAFFRYYYDPTFGLLSPAVANHTGQPFILMNSIWGSRIGIVFADAWMSVGAIRHAAGARRAGQRSEISLRGGGH